MKKKRSVCINGTFRELFSLFRVMKIMILCMLVGLTHLSAQEQEQNARVTLKLKDATVEQVVLEVEKQLKQAFFFSKREVDVTRKISVNFKRASLNEVVLGIFGEGYRYRLQGNMIVIMPKAPESEKEEKSVLMKGVVVDKDEVPLPGVTVLIEGTTVGCATDVDGKFSLSLPKELKGVVVIFRFVGMETRSVNLEDIRDKGILAGTKELKVVMQEQAEEMDEVVVTGIFTRKKEGFTGSATRVSGEELKRMTSGNVLKALQMLDPGFKMNASNLMGSNPNAIPDFQMRGQASMGNYQSDDVVVLRGDVNTRPNQPLFVLDGVIGVDATTIMDLDPEQVESITLLKDAAATVIYGSEAANGVVVVETKAPVPGKLRFTYNGNYELQWPDLSVYDLMNAKEKLQIEELAGFYNNKDDMEAMNHLLYLRQEVLRGVDTYWLAEPVQTAFAHRHGLTVEGGDRMLRYKIYLGARWAPGVMKKSDLNTKTGKIDLNYRVGKILINNSLTVDYSDGARTSPYGNFQDYAQVNPYYRKRDERGNVKQVLDDFYAGAKLVGLGEETTLTLNPLWNAQFDSKDDSRDFEVREALKVEYLPVESLRLSLDFTLSRNDGTVEMFKPAQHNDFYFETDPAKKGIYESTKREENQYRLSLSGAWNKSFGDHLLAVFARYSMNESSMKTTAFAMKGFPNDKLSEIHMGTEFQNTTGSESVARSLAFVMTLNYSYKQRYALDYSMSVNASSEFGKNNRYAPFWSLGVRWNLDRENFIQKLGIFDELILRGTYGSTGAQGFTPYQSLQMYTYTNLMKTYKSSDVVGTEIYGLGNPDLKWQQTENYNVSLDFSMWRNIVSAKLEYYEKYTKNTLLDYSMAPSVGFSTMKENLGKISNKGYEATLRLMPYSNPTKQAYWNIIFTGSHNKSRIEEISNALKVMNEKQMEIAAEEEDIYAADFFTAPKRQKRPLPRYENGYSQTTIWAVRSAGIDPQTGREMFITRDGQLTNEYSAMDQVAVGDTEPKFQGTVSTTFTYKGFSLTLAGQYRWGGQVFNQTLIDKVENANLRKNADRRALYSRWQKPGDQVFFKAIDGDVYKTDTKESSRFVMDDNEFYFSSMNLSYRVEGQKCQWLQRVGISSATLGLYMEDICRFSTVKMERGIDYPFSRRVSMSLSVTF